MISSRSARVAGSSGAKAQSSSTSTSVRASAASQAAKPPFDFRCNARALAALVGALRAGGTFGAPAPKDYAGPTLELADGGHGQVFVAAMGASSYT